MKNIKKMLFGIALLIISIIGFMLWMAGTFIGPIIFFATLVVGLLFVIDGFLSVDK
jgi:hypothetical protein